METLYLIALILIFTLAIFDLFVGVSNDAVNFLNSAVGSKAFKFKTILFIAALGIFVGASFSSGMMDIARHGIFQPQHFYFVEIMAIFMGVMITDVILLDTFNFFGMPTSTTVSMVFELLGGAFALSLFKIIQSNGDLSFGMLINTEKALSVIFAIFVSVAIAFTFGTIVQYITRLMLTFDFQKRLKYFIGLFGGLSFSSIVYFILFKGLKDSVIAKLPFFHFIKDYSIELFIGAFIFFALFSYLLLFLKINVFKWIVALGTFSLALAFAGNDLVNFIGVPLAALSSFQDFSANGTSVDTFLMTSLQSSASGDSWILVVAGVIMVIALLTSKKAHNVIKTSLSLSSQGESDEPFGTNPVARAVVRWSHSIGESIAHMLPKRLLKWTHSRLDDSKLTLHAEGASFDLVRASVNLMLASLLIAAGTSLKLPLSTTYVTFMVAMGTSLADKAWGRDSAVYRISGVLSVIGGWFFTAFAAFISAFIVCALIYIGGFPILFSFFVVLIFLLVRSSKRFKKKAHAKDLAQERFHKIMISNDPKETLELVRDHYKEEWGWHLIWVEDRYRDLITAFITEDLTKLRMVNHKIDDQKNVVKRLKRQGTLASRKMSSDDAIAKTFFLIQANDYASDMVFHLDRICDPSLQHVDNHFAPISKNQKKVLDSLWSEITDYIEDCGRMIFSGIYDNCMDLEERGRILSEKVISIRKEQTDLIKNQKSNTRASIVFLTILYETKSIVDTSLFLTKFSRKLMS
jgi:phosphate/sulfate permease